MIFSKFASGEHRGNQPNPLILPQSPIGGGWAACCGLFHHWWKGADLDHHYGDQGYVKPTSLINS
ncbi:hypothetical protein FIA77_11455 [Escherichia coli]|nr:hypothetical protein ECSTEC94C_1049 [Escherichia coli STEC_94C]MBW9677204.1 hypothetical protein [Escherichia coli]OTB42709.1 hypothetical protein AW060_21880 [Escherichia coli]TJP72362.1 hypothetical protein C9Z72_19420 [Escherichia coli]